MKYLILLTTVLGLNACASAEKIQNVGSVPATHGAVALNLLCADTVFTASIYNSGHKVDYWTIPLTEAKKIMHCNTGYQTVTLPEGNYFISSIVVKPKGILLASVHNRHTPEDQSAKFSILKGKTTYIGDIYYTTGEFPFDFERVLIGTTNVDVKYAIGNKEAAAKAFLQKDQPQLLQKLPLRTSLARQ